MIAAMASAASECLPLKRVFVLDLGRSEVITNTVPVVDERRLCADSARDVRPRSQLTQVRPIRRLPAVATIGCVTLIAPTPVLAPPTAQPTQHRPPTHRLVLAATAVLYIWGLFGERLGQQLLCGRRPGRVEELDRPSRP